MLDIGSLLEIFVLLGKTLLAVVEGLVDLAFLDFRVGSFSRIDNRFWASACCGLDLVQLALDSTSALFRQTLDGTGSAEFVELVCLIGRDVVNPVAFSEVGVLLSVSEDMIEGVPDPVDVLRLYVDTTVDVVDGSSPRYPFESGGRCLALECFECTLHANMHLLSNLAVFRGRTSQDGFRPPNKIANLLHFPESIQKSAILRGQCRAECFGSAGCIKRRPGCSNLCGYVRARRIVSVNALLHSATSAEINSPSARMWLTSVASRSFSVLEKDK